MSSINKTPHYNLSQFGDDPNDKPSWRGDYTGDMGKIDAQMYANAQAAQAAQTAATSATGTAQTASETAQSTTEMLSGIGVTDSGSAAQFKTKVDTAGTNADNALAYLAAMGVTNTSQGQSLVSSINNKAESTALASLSAQVSQKANANEVYSQSQSDARYTQTGGYEGTAQSLATLIQANTAKLSTVETNLSGVTATANAALPASKIGFWQGSGNTDTNASVHFTVPANGRTSLGDIVVIPSTYAANDDTSLNLECVVWYVSYSNNNFIVYLRYRQHSSGAWASGTQAAKFMQAMYLLK